MEEEGVSKEREEGASNDGEHVGREVMVKIIKKMQIEVEGKKY